VAGGDLGHTAVEVIGTDRIPRAHDRSLLSEERRARCNEVYWTLNKGGQSLVKPKNNECTICLLKKGDRGRMRHDSNFQDVRRVNWGGRFVSRTR